jgi:phospholipid/cholesterol/gamma-HCH transport system ATP-binding protein
MDSNQKRKNESSKKPKVQVEDLHKSFNGKQVLKGVSFEVYSGETLAIIGPSGCGKSTILKLLCGLLQPDKGKVEMATDNIGLVFQGSALLNSLTVRQNLSLALRGHKLKRNEETKKIEEKLNLVGLKEQIDSYPSQLSGGQQKRTSFARAIVYDPEIILYDEPTTGLDPVMSTIIEDYMIELESKLHAASIVVTHQLSTWTRTADRAVLLHDGKIVWQGVPQEAMNSSDPFIKQFAHASREGPMEIG